MCRLLTWNVLHGLDLASGSTDLSRLARMLAAVDADVIALQEVDRDLRRSGFEDQTEALAAALGMAGAFAPALLGDPDDRWAPPVEPDPGGPAYGVAILTREPAPATVRRLPGGGAGTRQVGARSPNPGWDREPRVALTVEVPAGGGVLRVTTTHLSYLPWRGLAQLRSAAHVAGAGGRPAVLLGDLNLPARVVRRALPRWHHPGGAPTYPAAGPRVQLDQVVATGGVEIRRLDTGPAGPSDHLPVLAEVRMP
jgi:endonuclease/exonuclease/phosphatase family metal-dependent hydrolase